MKHGAVWSAGYRDCGELEVWGDGDTRSLIVCLPAVLMRWMRSWRRKTKRRTDIMLGGGRGVRRGLRTVERGVLSSAGDPGRLGISGR